MTQTTEALRPSLPRFAPARSEPAERVSANAFRLGVAGCTVGVATFLAVQLRAWPPHEDETLALFVGRKSLGGLLHTVLGERGGPPLHFFLAWIVAHTGGGLTELRALSAIFAVASIPVMAAIAARLVGRTAALVATVLVSASWMLLFHGVYGRMASLFLFTSGLSFLAFLRALERGGWRTWALWAVAILLTLAAHPYGALVFAAQGVYAALVRDRLREALWAFAAVAVLAIPLWRTDLVLAGRFDIGVGGGGEKLQTPGSVITYLKDVAGDFTAGYAAAVTVVLLLALWGFLRLVNVRPRGALLAACVIGTPAAALMLARLGHGASPQSRHLIFALPFFAALVANGILRAARLLPRGANAVVVVAVACLCAAEVAWGWQKTPELYRGEAGARVAARHAASAWLAKTTRPDDVLFGYDPLYLEAWERGGSIPRLVVPRADPKLAFRTLQEARKPLGRGVWVFDASDTSNHIRSLRILLRYPEPRAAFEARTFGPFLIVRTRAPTGSIRNYLKLARRVELVGESLEIGDADVNLAAVVGADQRLARYERARLVEARRRSASTVSR